jgi:protein-tyrosine phosphatase
VLLGSVRNARDLGGVPLGEASVACGAIYRGGPLARLTPDGCAGVAALGIRTVIDLRTEPERASTPNSACVEAGSVLAPLPVPYGLGPSDYLNVLGTDASIAAVFHALGDEARYPVYFHCTYGRDRTGVVGALLLLALGASREDVMQEYLLSQADVGAYPNSLEAVLDEIEARGGAEALLTEIGISQQELALLRSRASAPLE